jgi:hypothetical protein
MQRVLTCVVSLYIDTATKKPSHKPTLENHAGGKVTFVFEWTPQLNINENYNTLMKHKQDTM